MKIVFNIPSYSYYNSNIYGRKSSFTIGAS